MVFPFARIRHHQRRKDIQLRHFGFMLDTAIGPRVIWKHRRIAQPSAGELSE
jgi:hypothetical protein